MAELPGDVRVRGEAEGEVDVEGLLTGPGTRRRACGADVPLGGSDLLAVLARSEGAVADGPGVAGGVRGHVR
ncbi:hypothetical protein BIV25_26290 [Streptomyces sp. MUSC 14]|nr:hypothetical protein BIV25_26290 [Streptomyces sp. MUSC 14]